MCEGEGLDLAGIEFVEDADGNRYTYDINGTTNYSGVFAEQVGIEGMWEVAKYIRGLVASDSDVIDLCKTRRSGQRLGGPNCGGRRA